MALCRLLYFSLQALYKAGEGKLGTDESGFFNILTGRTYDHLKVVFDEYMKQNSSSIEEAIKGEFGGVAQTALLEFGKFLAMIAALAESETGRLPAPYDCGSVPRIAAR